MPIEKFNEFGKTILNSGKGVGDIIDGKLVAIDFEGGDKLLLDGNVFPLSDYEIAVELSIINDETTTSILVDGIHRFQAVYPAWYVNQTLVAGMGMPDDEDEDFMAHLKVLLENPNRLKALRERYISK